MTGDGEARTTAEAPRRPHRYLVALDGLRGLAIIMVMLHNFTMTAATKAPTLGRAFEWGWVGVQLFFVMSGYLITRNLLAKPLTPGVLGAFMIRRCLRIVPVCYVLLAVYFWIVPALFDAPSIVAARHTQIWYWLFVSNWTEPFGLAAPGLGHLWSLAVEVQFYLLWPVIVLLAGPRRFGRACVAVIIIGLVSSFSLRLGGASPMAVYKFTVTRVSSLAVGALVAIVALRPGFGARIPVRALAGATSGALVAIAIWRGGFDYHDIVVETFGLKLASFLFALWLLPIAGVTPGATSLSVRLPSAPWLRAIGRLSYGMYVLHYPLHWVAMKHLYPRLLDADGAVSTPLLAAYVAAACVATYACARIMWTVVERPVLALKRYFPETDVRNPTMPVQTLAARGLGMKRP